MLANKMPHSYKMFVHMLIPLLILLEEPETYMSLTHVYVLANEVI